MVNAWSLAWEELNGTMNETYPVNVGAGNTAVSTDEQIHTVSLDTDLDAIAKSGGLEWTPGSPWPPKLEIDPDGGVVTADGYEHSDAYYDYTRNDPYAVNPFTDPKDRERAERVTGNIKINTKVDQSESMRELSINKSDYIKY